MIEVTSFLFKQLYDLMSDDDQMGREDLLFLAENQIPNLICETIVELLFILVSGALLFIMMALSEFYYEDDPAVKYMPYTPMWRSIQAAI